jgi:hypothetical protein
MHLVGAETYLDWLEVAGETCGCTLTGTALGFVDEEGSTLPWPGLKPGQNEMAFSGIVARGVYDADTWNACMVEWDMYSWYPARTGVAHRIGYSYYPYATYVNPDPHWSPRKGKDLWNYVDPSYCGLFRHNYTTLDAHGGDPLPNAWDSLRIVLEVFCSCDAFGVDSADCAEGPEGNTTGSPLTDNWRVGLLRQADAPPVGIIFGGLFMDGFGQNYPIYLEPSDVGNSNIARNHNSMFEDRLAYLGDSAVVTGPTVMGPEDRYLVEVGFRIARKGFSQEEITAYQQWVARLGADPTEGWVFALMDSMPEAGPGSHDNKFATYYHEDDPRFDPGYEDYTPEQEILPDQVFTPGTKIEYYFRSYWYNDGAPPEEYYVLGPWEYEILPGMRPAEEREENPYYTAVWPSILYIDVYNRGVEQYLDAAFREIDIQDYDRYDYLYSSASGMAPMARDTDGISYGNNGCTLEQFLGYRLVLVHIGNLAPEGTLEATDVQMFEDWLGSTECGITAFRRGFIFDGDRVGELVLLDDFDDFGGGVLGVTLEASSYRNYAGDDAYCVELARSDPYQGFGITEPGVRLYGSGCPNRYHSRQHGRLRQLADDRGRVQLPPPVGDHGRRGLPERQREYRRGGGQRAGSGD